MTQLNTPTRLPLTLGERTVSVSPGGLTTDNHSLALTADGAVWSWGKGFGGKLGHGDYQDQRQPKKIEALACQSVIAASAGYEYNLAITADGALRSWGSGDFGKLGHGNESSEQCQLLPKKIEAFAARVVAVSAGSHHSIALTGHRRQRRLELAGAMEALAGWATATYRTGGSASCCRRRSRPLPYGA